MSRIPVVAAIPNYNMAPALDRLLSQLIYMKYDAIYVLDDASTDDSAAISQKFENVTFFSLPVNKGSSAARNQILQFLDTPCIIHFLDADVTMQLDPTEVIRQHPFTEQTGFVGGRVLTEAKTIDPWNYGPKFGLLSSFTTILFAIFTGSGRKVKGNWILRLFKNRPFVQKGDESIHPYWVIESNLFIKSETFKRFGGFDEDLREHNIQPLAAKLSQAGYVNDFDSDITVTRTDDINVRPYNRLFARLKTEVYLIKKYIGLRRWLIGH